MPRATMIAAAASALVIAGLVALAAPAVATVAGSLSEWALFRPAAGVAPSGVSPVEEATDSEDLAERRDDAGEGLISVGNGTWFSAEGPGDCMTNAAIHPYGAFDPAARLGGELTDMGASDGASGKVGYTADGLIKTYTVVAGDSLIAIGERFCVDYVTVGAYNDRFGSKVIQPGDLLILRP